MSLFEVPGWSVPSAPLSQANKKRKRPALDSDDVNEAERIRAAQKNIEKLMRALGEGTGSQDAEKFETTSKKKHERKEKEKRKKGTEERSKVAEVGKAGKSESGRKTGRKQDQGGAQRISSKDEEGSLSRGLQQRKDVSPAKDKKQKQKQKQKRAQSVDARSDICPVHEEVTTPSAPKASISHVEKSPGKEKSKGGQQGLTALQANMRKSLDGARFRWINEMLYKADSAKAHELMSQDPAVFVDYHTGFRHQVESWPTNPVSYYISTLCSYPAKTVIADLGCGDAALARALVPKGMTVLSFDLVSDGAYVVQADTCTRVPLPGSEPTPGSDSGEGEGQIVDVAVCALSLMGTNWPGCIRETWRILRQGGEFKAAEVTSRFANVDEFVSLISSFGFELKAKDERNTHFTLFDFQKVSRKPKSEKDWEELFSRGSILKPCEYKRR